jgi:hypothetical protein
MINPTEAGAWTVAAKSGIELLKSAWSLLPKGANKDAIAHKIEEAEQALERADAKLAKELGYKLCECTFPPKPMLWNEARKLFICQNPDCGRILPRGTAISDETLRSIPRRPRYDLF